MTPTANIKQDETRSVLSDPKIQGLLIELSKSFIHDAFDGDTDSCLALLDNKVEWLSPFSEFGDYGAKGFKRLCDRLRGEGSRTILVQENFEVLSVYPESCCIVAHAFLYIGSAGGGSVLGRPLRVVFNWRVHEGGSVRISYLEVTLPVDRDTLGLPDEKKSETMDYPKNWDSHVEFKDDQGIVHYVDEDRIVYVEAQGRKTVVYCDNDEMVSQDGIGTMEEMPGSQFIRLHRTYLVNGWKVKSLSSRGATMTNGHVLPVPVRRLVALREEINQVRKPRHLSLSDLEKTIKAAIVDANNENDSQGASERS